MPLMSFSPATHPHVALLFAIGLFYFSQTTDSFAADKLVVGSIAPKLNVEHWVQNGSGKFPKVTDFKSGRVYVVEFWATTCGPCVQSMPHLAELQTNYAVAAIDGYIAKISDRRIQFGLYKSKIDMQIRSSADIKDITKSYEDLFASCAEEPLFVQDVAWSAYEAYVENRLQSKKIIRTSIAAVEKALPLVEGANKANLFDTIARLYSGIGDLQPAIQAQTQAVKLSDGSDQGSFKEFLQELQNEAKKSKK